MEIYIEKKWPEADFLYKIKTKTYIKYLRHTFHEKNQKSIQNFRFIT